MKLSYPVLHLAIIAFASLLIATPTRSYADTYQLFGLGIDNTHLYGMDDGGHVAFDSGAGFCPGASSDCYNIFYNGTPLGRIGTVPAYTWDYTAGSCTSIGLLSGHPCSVTDNGRTATLENISSFTIGVFVQSGSAPPQLITTAFGIDGIFAIDGLGDIVFDNGNLDEWYEAVDLTTSPVPEPASFFLLATGLLALTIPLRRRLAQ